MNRHNARRNAMIVVYQSLIKKVSPLEILETGFSTEEFIPPFDLDPYFEVIVEMIATYKDEFIEAIASGLNDWSFARLGYIEQAILLVAYAELVSKQTDRAIILDQAVTLAKSYGEEQSYKLINGTLDHL